MALLGTVYPPEIWALESLMVLRDELLMARLVHSGFSDDVASFGDTVQTRKPVKATARTWGGQAGTDANSTIDVENPNARNLTVLLDTLVYTAILVEDRDQTTSRHELRDEFIVPIMDPIAQRIDDDIMTEFTSGSSLDVHGNAVSLVAFDTVGLGADLNDDDIITARETLNVSQCPMSPRVLVLSPQHESDLLRTPIVTQADQSGSVDALRAGRVGRLFGFDTFMSQNVPTAVDTDATPISLAFHRNAITYVNRPLDNPQTEGVRAAVQSLDGNSMRVVEAYDIDRKGHVLSVDVLYGTQLLDANLAVIINP